MKLSGEEANRFQNALLAAFPSKSDLAQMVRFRLEYHLEIIVGGENQAERVFNLIIWAEAKGFLEDLIRAACLQQPRSPDLVAFTRSIGFVLDSTATPSDSPVAEVAEDPLDPPATPPLPPPPLEEADRKPKPPRVRERRARPVTGRNTREFKQLRTTLLTDLARLREYAVRLHSDQSLPTIDLALTKLQNDSLTIAFVGEFHQGKSTIINALLGREVLSTDVLRRTTAIIRIVHALRPSGTVMFKDGHTQDMDFAALSDHVSSTLSATAQERDRAGVVAEGVVRYPLAHLHVGVEFVDTPGLNYEAALDLVTHSAVPCADVAVVVMRPEISFSQSIASFLEHTLLPADLSRVILILTGIDDLRPAEAGRIADFIHQRVQKNIMQRTAEVHGPVSVKYKSYARKLGGLQLFCVAGRLALAAKLANDPHSLAASHFPEFEAALARFLTEERGALLLQVAANRTLTAAQQILDIIGMQETRGITQERQEWVAMRAETTRIQDSAQRLAEQIVAREAV